jgi:hypothetical protein
MKRFIYDDIQTVYSRKRAFLDGELVGLSCGKCKFLQPLEGFHNNQLCYAGKHVVCKRCKRDFNKNYSKYYHREQRHKQLASMQNYRAKQQGTEGKLNEHNTEIILACAGVRTVGDVRLARCQVTGIWTSDYHLCHVQPLRAGGNSEYSNIFVATRQVNIRQGNMHLLEWLLTESAHEIANPEYVQWLLESLAQRNMRRLKDYVVSEIGLEGYERLLELYFEE